jgi:hypothetical protein
MGNGNSVETAKAGQSFSRSSARRICGILLGAVDHSDG